MAEDQSPEIESVPSPRRRNLLKAIAIGAGLAVLPDGVKILSDIFLNSHKKRAIEAPLSPPLAIPSFPDIELSMDLPQNAEWDSSRLQSVFETAIQESLLNKHQVEVQLPSGTIQIDKTVVCQVPEGSQIVLKGHPNGTTLRLNPSLSDIPAEWESFAQRNILLFKDVEGEIELDGINFHGGSERAGKEGYVAPPSPWNSMLFIVGKGDGSKYDSAMERAGNRKGKALVRNCNFGQSESGGILLQNLSSAQAEGCKGKNLDVLFNSSWSDYVTATSLVGENFTSDGFYITSAQQVELNDCRVKTARQGYDLQGVSLARLKDCHAYDCGKGYELTLSETDKKTTSHTIIMNNCHTDGCMEAYSIGPVQNLVVNNCLHDNVGDWYQKYQAGDFLHSTGIVRPEDLIYWKNPIVDYTLNDNTGHQIDLKKHLAFTNTKIRSGKYAPPNYTFTDYPGIQYFQPN